MTHVKALGLVALTLVGCASNTISSPGNIPLLEKANLAEQAYLSGDHVEAVRLYEQLTQAMPDEAVYWYRLANVYVRSERQQEAVFAYQRSLAIDSRNARAWYNLGIVLLGQSQEAFLRGTHTADADSVEHAQSQRMLELLAPITGTEAPNKPAPDASKQPVPPDSVE